MNSLRMSILCLAGTRLWEQFVAPIDRPGNPIARTKYPAVEFIPGFKRHVEVRQPPQMHMLHIVTWQASSPINSLVERLRWSAGFNP